MRPSLLLLWFLLLCLPPSLRAGDVCWRDSYGRGVGTIPGTCELYQEKSGLLCYPKCKKGYTGVAFVCWQDCPPGFKDHGAFCAKPGPYGRGAGFPWKFGDKAFSLKGAKKRCEKRHGSCEKNGAIYYPKCKKGFHPVGCCVCSPDCPPGMKDIGVSCAKKSYTRSTHTPNCGPGKEYDAGLCYKKCKPGYEGVGPVCWGSCPPSHPVNCGASCARSSGECASAVTDQVVSVVDVAATIATSVATGGAGTAAKTAARTAGKAAVKVSTKAAVRQSARQGLRKAAGKLQKTSRAQIRQSLRKLRGEARRKGKREADQLSDERLEKLAEALDNARTAAELGTEPPTDALEVLEMVDPTGLVAVVQAYNKPICNAPTPAPTRLVPTRPAPPRGRAGSCRAAVQGKIAWDYQGNRSWASGNLQRLCGDDRSAEPAKCFQRVMHGGVSWGGGTRWKWENALDLCERSRDANATVSCFQAALRAGQDWSAAITRCGAR